MNVVPASRVRRRIDPGVARQIDRLSRRAHRFHRFAHHPLCDRYSGEIVRIGKTRLCRGCTFAIAGGIAGGLVGLAIGPSIAIGAVAVAVGTALLFGTMWGPRLGKRWTRLVPAALLALAIPCSAVVAAVAIAIVIVARVLYGRRGADRAACATCPELGSAPCSGFARIVARERAFQRVASRMVATRAAGEGM